jgi:hypothetical protein
MKKPPYSMDADPAGIRELVAVTISGVIAMGAQDESPAPAGHWLGEFWQFGRSAGQWRSTVWAVARALNCLPSTYADANGHVLRAAEKLTAERDELKAEVERLRGLAAPTHAEIDQSIELTWHMAWRERDQMGVAGPVSEETTKLAWRLHNERVAAICDETRPAASNT